jgi:phospholipid transport system substrate-binding protein
MVANYAGQFDGYSGQSFETLGEEPARMDTVLVKSRLIDPTDENIELNYRMRQVDGKWKIIDVYLDGTVSELALRRSEFSGIVKRKDFDALIAAIDERIAKLAAGTEES